MANPYLTLADAILTLHVMVVLFIIGALIIVWVGHFKRWQFVRNFWFRLSHLGAIGYVSIQTLFGIDCPLTVWENQLRDKGGSPAQYQNTFIGHWLGKILFYDISLGVFAIVYTTFFALVVFTWFRVKPRSPRRHAREPAA